jgi:hypothetical protein
MHPSLPLWSTKQVRLSLCDPPKPMHPFIVCTARNRKKRLEGWVRSRWPLNRFRSRNTIWLPACILLLENNNVAIFNLGAIVHTSYRVLSTKLQEALWESTVLSTKYYIYHLDSRFHSLVHAATRATAAARIWRTGVLLSNDLRVWRWLGMLVFEGHAQK